MGTATQTDNGRVAHRQPRELQLSLATQRRGVGGQIDLAGTFAATVTRYLLLVMPQVSSELSRWREQAREIPNRQLRDAAIQALRKRGNIEGAALFATLAPAANRRITTRALVSFQTAYNYLDALSELPGKDPIANGEQLHQALLTALHPDAPHPDYFAYSSERGDGGYLRAIVEECRKAFAGLPSSAAFAPSARCAAARIVDFQALNLNDRQGGHRELRRWARELTPSGNGLAWWETAAAAGSSLAVHALIAAAADPQLDEAAAREIDRAYFFWIGALHSLLDSLVDRREDHQRGQRSLLDYYHSPTDAAVHLAMLADRGRRATERLPRARAHRVILTAMCSYYLSAPECDTAEAHRITRALTQALGLPLNVATLMFRSKRAVHSLTDRTYA